MHVRHITCLLFAICTTLLVGQVGAQNLVFSQFYANPLLLNPAFAGASGAPRLALNHRSQYVGFASTVPYQSYAVGYGQYVPGIRSGIGITLVADNAGDNLYESYSAMVHYSYQVNIDKENSIRVGLSAGAQQRRLDWERLIFGDQLNPVTGPFDRLGNTNTTNEDLPDRSTVTFADFSAGLLYAGKVAYLGVSLDHLTRPDERLASIDQEGFYKGLPMRISAHAGAQIALNDSRNNEAFVTPNILYTRQGPAEQLNAGAYAKAGRIFGGAWFRYAFANPDAAIGVIGVEWDMYKIGYSYDFTVSSLRQTSNSNGTHEVSLLIDFSKSPWYEQRKRNNRYNDCLNLFR